MNKKRLNGLFVFALSLILVLSGCVFFESKKQVNAETEPISIYTIEDLKKIGNDLNFPLNANYILMNDLDFSMQENPEKFVPIGVYADQGKFISISAFTGVFDGNGYKIKNLEIKSLIEETEDLSFYHAGLFGMLYNATVKNLAIENLVIAKTRVVADVATNQTVLFAGGIAGVAEGANISNCYVSFKPKSDEQTFNKITGRVSIYFGGLVGELSGGSKIENCYANLDMNILEVSSQGSEIKFGGLVGCLYSSFVYNSYATGVMECNLQSEDEGVSPIGRIVGGGIVGFVSGRYSEVLSTYFNGKIFANSQNQQIFLGGFIGEVIPSQTVTPLPNNLDFSYYFAKTNNNAVLNNAFGNQNFYLSDGLTVSKLDNLNFGIFNFNNYWQPYHIWDFTLTWTLNTQKEPSLQIFNQYEIALKEAYTTIDFGGDLPQSNLIEMRFLEGDEKTKSFRFGSLVGIRIEVTADYKLYYELDSVFVNSNQIASLGGESSSQYTLVDLYQTGEESIKGVYLFAFYVNDKTAGDISVRLKRISYEITVKSENPNMGKVRRPNSNQTTQELTEKIADRTTYSFFAVPNSNDYAFSKWILEVPAIGGGEPTFIDLGDAGLSSQIVFTFGKNDSTIITENVLMGGKLIAIFTSNITKVNFVIKLKNSDQTENIGIIKYSDGSNPVPVSGLVSLAKDKLYTLTVEPKEGYTFEGWYDKENRVLSYQEVYSFIPSEDEYEIVARFVKVEEKSSNLWLWLTIGGVGLVLLVIIIVIIKKKTEDNAYKNFF